MHITSPGECSPYVSYLTKVYYDAERGWVLFQALVTEQHRYASFAAMVPHFMATARFQREQTGKYHTNSWLPTPITKSARIKGGVKVEPEKIDFWRNGDYVADALTLWYGDLDNHAEDQPLITMDQVHAYFVRRQVSHFLYTSYSHSPEKHKVRIMLPISREMTYDEAHHVYVLFNHDYFTGHLDGSIYDRADHLYGPTFAGETLAWLDGQSLDVDAALSYYEALPDDVKSRYPRNEKKSRANRELTGARLDNYKAQIAAVEPSSDDVSITNPKYFNPDWNSDLNGLYKDGSHHQTLLGLLTRCWLKSGGTLSMGDMVQLYRDIDGAMFGYVSKKYGHMMSEDIRAAMSISPSAPVELSAREYLEQKVQRKLAWRKSRGI